MNEETEKKIKALDELLDSGTVRPWNKKCRVLIEPATNVGRWVVHFVVKEKIEGHANMGWRAVQSFSDATLTESVDRAIAYIEDFITKIEASEKDERQRRNDLMKVLRG